jgi:negative regulator of sigma E activity
MNEELDSQLSAMFDNELPAAQCELLARRLSRDEEQKARWARYAAIGATIRAEGGPRLNTDLARRVSVAISAEPAVESTELAAAVPMVSAHPAQQVASRNVSRWWAPVGGVAVAASVAAAAILWVRYESPVPAGPAITQLKSVPVGSGVTQNASLIADTRPSYVVPKATPRRPVGLSSQLANYVVAHSEFSSPVNRRNLLSALMSSESGTAGAQAGSEEPTEDVDDDATSPQ